ncbi:MAG: hypothetical protein IKB73_00970 [Ruminococcus sp.]|nr:hypothetical protein [Ruminococcus sp.]
MKKLISLCLVIVLMLSMAIVGVSAKESKPQNVLHFDTNTANHWGNNYSKVYCHIWGYDGDTFFRWQSNSEKCTDEDGDGIWTYDLDYYRIVLEDDKSYCVIFSNDNGRATYTMTFDTTVLGDTAYCDGSYYDSPEEYHEYFAYWRNQDSGLHGYGPQLQISSIGQIVGTCIPKTESAQHLFEKMLIYNIENARTYSGKSDQDIIDDVAKNIELTISDVIKGIEKSGKKVSWKWWESSLEMGEFVPITGDVDGDLELSVMDATLIQLHKSEILTIPEKLLIYGDVDKDTDVSVLDATQIQQYIAQLI